MAEQTTELFQGDSSDILAVKVYSGDVQVTDLTGYTGKLIVVKHLGDTPLLNKNMTIVGSELRVQLTPTESNNLPPECYKAILQVENAVVPFRKEHHVELRIKKQGYNA